MSLPIFATSLLNETYALETEAFLHGGQWGKHNGMLVLRDPRLDLLAYKNALKVEMMQQSFSYLRELGISTVVVGPAGTPCRVEAMPVPPDLPDAVDALGRTEAWPPQFWHFANASLHHPEDRVRQHLHHLVEGAVFLRDRRHWHKKCNIYICYTGCFSKKKGFDFLKPPDNSLRNQPPTTKNN